MFGASGPPHGRSLRIVRPPLVPCHRHGIRARRMRRDRRASPPVDPSQSGTARPLHPSPLPALAGSRGVQPWPAGRFAVRPRAGRRQRGAGASGPPHGRSLRIDRPPLVPCHRHGFRARRMRRGLRASLTIDRLHSGTARPLHPSPLPALAGSRGVRPWPVLVSRALRCPPSGRAPPAGGRRIWPAPRPILADRPSAAGPVPPARDPGVADAPGPAGIAYHRPVTFRHRPTATPEPVACPCRQSWYSALTPRNGKPRSSRFPACATPGPRGRTVSP
jgi:hypothetical protein